MSQWGQIEPETAGLSNCKTAPFSFLLLEAVLVVRGRLQRRHCRTPGLFWTRFFFRPSAPGEEEGGRGGISPPPTGSRTPGAGSFAAWR